MNHYLLLYEFVDDYAERRAPHRQVHLAMAWDAHEKGDLVMGGALPGDPPRAPNRRYPKSPVLTPSASEAGRVTAPGLPGEDQASPRYRTSGSCFEWPAPQRP